MDDEKVTLQNLKEILLTMSDFLAHRDYCNISKYPGAFDTCNCGLKEFQENLTND